MAPGSLNAAAVNSLIFTITRCLFIGKYALLAFGLILNRNAVFICPPEIWCLQRANGPKCYPQRWELSVDRKNSIVHSEGLKG